MESLWNWTDFENYFPVFVKIQVFVKMLLVHVSTPGYRWSFLKGTGTDATEQIEYGRRFPRVDNPFPFKEQTICSSAKKIDKDRLDNWLKKLELSTKITINRPEGITNVSIIQRHPHEASGPLDQTDHRSGCNLSLTLLTFLNSKRS